MYELQRDSTPQLARKSTYYMPRKEMPRNSESKLENDPCGFCPGRSTMDQIFTLKQIFEKSWEYGKDLLASFVDLETAYDQVLMDKVWKVLLEYGFDDQVLRVILLSTGGLFLGKWQAIKAVPCGRWTPARVHFVIFFFYWLYQLDRQMHPNWWMSHDWKLQN